jgi:hypothetical protein
MSDPGKYDDLCTVVREATNAEGVILIVINGNKGNGFSVQATARIIPGIPDMLEFTAGEIRKQVPKDMEPVKPSQGWWDKGGTQA